MEASLLFLGLAFHGHYRAQKPCTPGSSCADPQVVRRQRLVVWCVTVLLLGLLAVPWLALFFY
jgi:mercuric ion transport protein